jgi:hypothetical protein
MHPTPQRSQQRSFVARLSLAVLLVLSVLTLSRCTLVGDRLTGVDVARSRQAPVPCIVECQRVANEEIRVESVLHVSNVNACDGDADCLADEESRHEAAVNDIQAGREVCVDGCHDQGGGQGAN